MGDIDKYNVKSTTNVFFDTGKAVLSPTAKADLCNAANTADPMQGELLLVVGYTDSTGSDSINNPLSVNRAAAVRDYLVDRGVAAQRVAIDGRGSREPIADNATAEGRAQNRRVELRVEQ